MLNFIKETLRDGGLAISYAMRDTMVGNECEYRWKKFYNSRVEYIKTEYNVSPKENDEIVYMLALCITPKGIMPVIYFPKPKKV